jgi:hypothetical protein
LIFVPKGDSTTDLLLYQGKTVSYNLSVETTAGAFNLSGYSGRLKARKGIDGDIITSFSSTDNSIVFPSATAGQIRLVKSATATAAIAACCGVYDFEIESSTGNVKLLMRGGIKVIPEVTD